MAKADIKLPNGTHIQIDGGADDISSIIKLFNPSNPSPTDGSGKKHRRTKSNDSPKPQSAKRAGPQQRIEALASENFFKTKKTIADVQSKLEEQGHIYPQTHISTPLIRLARKRTLRRIKEGGTWLYINN
jgi:hypothetical protein